MEEKKRRKRKRKPVETKWKSSGYTILSWQLWHRPRGWSVARIFTRNRKRKNETAEVTRFLQKCSFPGWRLIAISWHFNQRCTLFHRPHQPEGVAVFRVRQVLAKGLRTPLILPSRASYYDSRKTRLRRSRKTGRGRVSSYIFHFVC